MTDPRNGNDRAMSAMIWAMVVLIAWVPLVIAAVQLTELWRRHRRRRRGEAAWWPDFERQFRAYAERVAATAQDAGQRS